MCKKLAVKEKKCIGCSLCLLYCVFEHKKIYSEEKARLKLERDDSICLCKPVVCQQCKNADCMQACPERAISRSDDGLVAIDSSLCSGCGLCVDLCPFGVMMFDEYKNKAFKCDLCGGDPACVRCCPTGALIFK